MATLDDTTVRRAAFEYVRNSLDANGLITGAHLKAGVRVAGEHVHLLSAGGKGIFKPKQLDIPLYILTKAPVNGREAPYDDELDVVGGLLHYRYQGTNPTSHDNRALRLALQTRTPLLYLFGVARGSAGASSTYLPSVARIIDEKPGELAFVLTLEELSDNWEHLEVDLTDMDPRIESAFVQRRLDQQAFRSRVLQAYRNRCALCRLNQLPLLDAAHIKPHSERGHAIVPNGLAMCTLHHRAFDRDIIGIAPNHQVTVRTDVLQDRDGPMLRHGLQEFDQRTIWVPRGKNLAPDPAFLEERYAQFRAAT